MHIHIQIQIYIYIYIYRYIIFLKKNRKEKLSSAYPLERGNKGQRTRRLKFSFVIFLFYCIIIALIFFFFYCVYYFISKKFLKRRQFPYKNGMFEVHTCLNSHVLSNYNGGR